jgi:hypothetical protein
MLMDHVDDKRLMELALDARSRPQNGEATHLELCEECSQRLARERQLTEMIAELERREPRPEFTAAAVARFARATRARQLKSLPWGLLICLAVAAPMIALAVADPGLALGSAGRLIGELAVLSRVLVTVLEQVPTIGVVLAAAFCVAAVVCCWALAGLARKTRPVKYRGR